MPFDYEGAKKAGYSDEEINAQLGIDYTGALNAGYQPQEIDRMLVAAEEAKTVPQVEVGTPTEKESGPTTRDIEREESKKGLSGAVRQGLLNLFPPARVVSDVSQRGEEYIDAAAKAVSLGGIVDPAKTGSTFMRYAGAKFKDVADRFVRDEESGPKDYKIFSPIATYRKMDDESKDKVNKRAKELKGVLSKKEAFSKAIAEIDDDVKETRKKNTLKNRVRESIHNTANKVIAKGKDFEDYLTGIEETLEVEELKGLNVWDAPKETLGSPLWWMYNGSRTATNVGLTSALPAGAVYKGLKLAPSGIARMAKLGASITGGVSGGLQSAAPVYRDVLKSGGTHREAASAAQLHGAATAALEAVGIDQFMKSAGTGFLQQVSRRGLTGIVEGLTEGIEEPTSVFAKLYGKYVTGQPLPKNIKELFIQSFKNAASSAPFGFLLGAGGGGNVRQSTIATSIKDLESTNEALGTFSESSKEQRKRIISDIVKDPTAARDLDRKIKTQEDTSFENDRVVLSPEANKLINVAEKLTDEEASLPEETKYAIAGTLNDAKKGDPDAIQFLNETLGDLAGVKNVPVEITSAYDQEYVVGEGFAKEPDPGKSFEEMRAPKEKAEVVELSPKERAREESLTETVTQSKIKNLEAEQKISELIEKSQDGSPLSAEEKADLAKAFKDIDQTSQLSDIESSFGTVAPPNYQDRRAEAREGQKERRVNSQLRDLMGGLTTTEKQTLLSQGMHSKKTGLPTKEAYEMLADDDNIPREVAAIKVSDIGKINAISKDTALGDQVIEKVGEALKENAENPFYFDGNEFIDTSNNQDAIIDSMERVQDYLIENPIEYSTPEGDVIKITPNLQIGIGDSIETAKADRDSTEIEPGVIEIKDKDGKDVSLEKESEYQSFTEKVKGKEAKIEKKEKKENDTLAMAEKTNDTLSDLVDTVNKDGSSSKQSEDIVAKEKAPDLKKYWYAGEVNAIDKGNHGTALIEGQEREIYESEDINEDDVSVLYDTGRKDKNKPIAKRATIPKTAIKTPVKRPKAVPLPKPVSGKGAKPSPPNSPAQVNKGIFNNFIKIPKTLGGIFKAGKRNFNKEDPDFSALERLAVSPLHLFEKIPAAQRIFEHGNMASDEYSKKMIELTHSVHGKSMLLLMKDFKKKNRKEYNKLKQYLVDMDVNDTGYQIIDDFANDDFTVIDKNNKFLMTTKDEAKAEDYAIGKEAADMKKAGFTKAGILAMINFRRLTINGYHAYSQPIRKLIAEQTAKGIEIPSVKIKDTVTGKEVKVSLRKAVADMGTKRTSYYPRSRESKKWIVSAKKKGEHPIIETFDTALFANNFDRKYTEKGYKVFKRLNKKVTESVFEDLPNRIGVEAIVNKGLEGVGESAKGKLPDDVVNGMKVELATQLVENIANIQKLRGARKHMVKRKQATGKNVWKGYEEDPLLAVTQYMNSIAGGEAKRITQEKMIRTFTGTEKSYKEFRDEAKAKGVKVTAEDYVKYTKANRIDPTSKAYDTVKNYMNENLRNREFLDRFIGTMKSLAVLKYMSGRIASSAVNMTNLVTGVPMVAEGEAGIPINQTMLHVSKALGEYTAWAVGGKKAKSNWTQRAIDHMQKNGWDDAQMNREAFGILNSGPKNLYSNILEKLMTPFAITERMNKAGTIIGIYNALKARKGENHWGIADHEKAMIDVKKMSDLAHAVYGKANALEIASGNKIGNHVARTFLTFTSFSHNYLLNLRRYGFKVGKLKTGKGKNKAMLWGTFSPALVAGIAASPAYAIIMPILKHFMDEDPEESLYDWIEEEINPLVGNMARTGGAGLGGYGVDLRGSMAMNPMEYPTTLAELGGAPFSVMSDLHQGALKIEKGQVLRGVEEILPNFIGGKMKAIRERTEGMTDRRGDKIFYGVNPIKSNNYEVFYRLLDFNPARLSTIRERQWHGKLEEQKIGKISNGIKEEYFKYMMVPEDRRSKAKLAEIIEEIEIYNALITRRRAEGKTSKKGIDGKSLKAYIQGRTRPNMRERIREISLKKKSE